MKKTIFSRYFLLFLLGIAVSQAACKKPGGPGGEQEVVGLKCPVGVPAGNTVTASIGVAGGTIAYPDNSIKITIPQGALSETTTISIEPISNTNVAGKGKAFRLTPHGIQFSKPVAITFSYAEIADSVSLADMLGLAYQDGEGIWQFIGASNIDRINKTVTYNSTHFSDWAIMEVVSLYPVAKTLSENDELTIQAFIFVKNDNELEIPHPLTNTRAYPVGWPVPLPANFIKKWELEGPGQLREQSRNVAKYKAPSPLLTNASATVKLTLNSQGNSLLLLLSQIKLLSSSFFEMRIKGGSWRPLPAELVMLTPGKMSIAVVEENERLSVFFPDRVGTFSWGHADNQGYFNYWPTGSNFPTYMSTYENEQHDLVLSGGSVIVTEMGSVGQYVRGTFRVDPAGAVNSEGKQIDIALIEARFALKRRR